LGDGHTHFSWNGGDLDQLGTLGVEEHTLLTMRSAQCFLDSGYTMCFGAAAAKERLDVVIRDAINAGDIPGPRYLANGKEMARRGGELVGGITAFADGPDEMREVIRHHVGIGVDNVKLSISGEEVLDMNSLLQSTLLTCIERLPRSDRHKTATLPTKRWPLASMKLISMANGYARTPALATPSSCL
jgi:septum formation topological specificity factor MinE